MIASINYVPRCIGTEIPYKTYKLIEWSGIVRFDTAGIPIISPIGKVILDKIYSVVKSKFVEKGIYPWQFPDLIEKRLFIRSGRYEEFGKEIFHLNGDRYVLNASLEEFVIHYLENIITTYRQLPLYIFSTSKRFRDTAAKRGINRLKEFTMTDIFGIHIDELSAISSFNEIKKVFLDIFASLELKIVPCEKKYPKRIFFFCFSGEGEHYVQTCSKSHTFEGKGKRKCDFCNNGLEEKRAFGVGIFMICCPEIIDRSRLKIDSKSGKISPVMASYSLGIERLLYAVVEQHRDEYGIKYPSLIRPFERSILLPKNYDNKLKQAALELYNTLNKIGKQCFLDDRIGICLDDKRLFSDVIGIPEKIIVRYLPEEKYQFFYEKRGSKMQIKASDKFQEEYYDTR